ncbi:hypothetical protein CLOM_g207 [Closterium sp. NIES-68]|nr:hypothetical protein CLOM_g207 [Closterium sp. NIES-68]GJP68035.1 hypothetical protein CLOP_g24791 [Closterium sp. NIES-67]
MMAESPPSIPLRSNETPDPPTPNQQPELVRQQLRCRGLEPFRVGRVSSVYVVPDYLTVQEEQLLMSQVASAPITKWKNVTGRRLQNWGGVVHDKGLIAQPLPAWLQHFTSRISSDLSSLFPSPVNHVLVNEYKEGQGIMPHQDGPAYFPCVAILSLGLPATMAFTPHQRLAQQHGEGSERAGAASKGAAIPCADSDSGGDGKEEVGGAEAGERCSDGGGGGVMMRECVAAPHSEATLETPVVVVRRECAAVPPRSLLVFKDEAYTGEIIFTVLQLVLQQKLHITNLAH